MSEKKKSIEYRVNDLPPPVHLVVLSFQHIMFMVIALSFPVLLAGQLNASPEFTASLIAFSMIASGLGSIIQAVGLPFIGSKYLCPNVCGPSYYSLSLSAAWVGGLPLMRGMIMVAGLIEMAIAPIIQKLKRVFPGYIVGLVVAMVGVSIIKSSISSIFGLSYEGDAIRNLDLVIGGISLAVMVLCNLWGKGLVKVYCLLIGMAVGWILALLLEPEYLQSMRALKKSPFFSMPSPCEGFWKFTFDLKMLVPFTVIALSGSLKSFGNLLAAQKISEPELENPNFVPIRKGLLADGFSTALAGFLGGMAVDTSSSNIGLAGATKVVSRWICVTAGVIFIVLAFFPKLLTALSMMPRPVLGAALVFSGCFMLCTGFIEMFQEAWNQRKTFVVGIALFFGLSTAFLPSLYARAPEFIKTFFTDPLPTTTILAVVLHQLVNLDLVFKKNE